MPSASSLSLYFTLFLLFWMIVGFLWGFIRGARRSLIRLLVLGGFAVLLLLISGAITARILEVEVSGKPMFEHITGAITSGLNDVGIQGAVGTASVAHTLVIALVTPIVFALLFFACKIISWPIYAILASIFAKKNHPNRQKRPLIGGLIGMAQGFFICFLLFVPLSGYARAAERVVETGVFEQFDVDAETAGNIDDFAFAYSDSFAGKLFRITGQRVWFNMLATRTDDVTGIRVKATNEINVVVDVIGSLINQDVINLFDEGIDALYDNLKQVPTEPAGETRTRADIIVNEITSPLFRSVLLRQLLVDAVNSFGTHTIGTPTNLRVSRINWRNESRIFSESVSDGFLKGYGLVRLIDEDGETEAIAEKFGEVGAIIDNFRRSQLVGAIFNDGILHLVEIGNLDLTVSDSIDLDFTGPDGNSVFNTATTDIKDGCGAGCVCGDDCGKEYNLIVSDLIGALLESETSFEFLGTVIGELFIVADAITSGDISDIGIGVLNTMFYLLGNIEKDSELADLLNAMLDAIVRNHLLDAGMLAHLPSGWTLPNIVGNAQNAAALAALVNLASIIANTATTGVDNWDYTDIRGFANDLRDVGALPGGLDELIDAVAKELLPSDVYDNMNMDDFKNIFVTETDAIEVLLLLNNGYCDKLTADEIIKAFEDSTFVFDLLSEDSEGEPMFEVSVELYADLQGKASPEILALFAPRA